MIIYDLYLFRMSTPPDKANSPLIVDTDAMLAFTISLQGFQLIGRGEP
jgi:hypothetical protein